MKSGIEILEQEMKLYNEKGKNSLPLPEMYKVRFSDSEKEFIQRCMDIHALQFKQPLTKKIENYIRENGLESLDILMKQAWDNGFLTNVQIKLEKHGTNKFGNSYD